MSHDGDAYYAAMRAPDVCQLCAAEGERAPDCGYCALLRGRTFLDPETPDIDPTPAAPGQWADTVRFERRL